MIRVKKPKAVPSILISDGAKETKINKKAYVANKAKYKSGKLKFDIIPKIYNGDSVKATLKSKQHEKCCFCEKKQRDEWGAVEHFRPKEGYKNKKGEKPKKPGYYWLGYDWANLYFVCSWCNTSHKGVLFPLEDPNSRAICHLDDLRKETPLLLDPGGRKDPEKHITFEMELVKPKEGSKFGKATINVCGLDRLTLNDERKDVINEIHDRILTLLDPDSGAAQKQRAKTYIKAGMEPTAGFSSAATCYIKSFKNITIK